MADNGFNPNSAFGQAVRNMGMDRPEVSEETYDSFRNHYFESRIASRLPPEQRAAKRATFLQRTQRPKMPTAEYLKTLSSTAFNQLGATLDKTAGVVSSSLRKRGKMLQEEVTKGQQALDYHGKFGGKSSAFVGGSTAYVAEMAAGEGVIAPIVGAIPKAAAAVAAFPRLLPAAARSLGFGTLMAAEAEPGHRKSDFLTGTAWGVGGEMAGAVLGRLWKFYKGRKGLPSTAEVDDYLKKMARGEVEDTQLAKDMDQALADEVKATHKEPGYLKSLKLVVNEKRNSPLVTFVDKNGTEFVSGIPAGSLERSYATIKEAIENGRILQSIEHDSYDIEYINELVAKLKQNYEPWAPVASQVATNATNVGIDAGGGTARLDEKVMQYRYAKEAPDRVEARRFIKAAGVTDNNQSTKLMSDFDTVWNPFSNWIVKEEAATRLEDLGLTDLIPSPQVRAKWRPSEGMNLPQMFNERGWYSALDRWKGRTETGEDVTLDVRQKEHLNNAMKTLWNPEIPHNSTMFRSALRAITQFDLNEFLPGVLTREEVGSLLNEGRAGTETAAKAAARVDMARGKANQPPPQHIYQQIQTLAETFAKSDSVDEARYVKQYGQRTVEAAKQMAALMWEKSKGDIFKLQWNEETLKMGIREGILPQVDPNGKPAAWWFKEGEEHIAQAHGIDDVESLRRASTESKTLRLAEAYNVDPKSIDSAWLEEVGEAEVARAQEIADIAKKSGVSVYDQSILEEAKRLGKFEDTPFSPREVPPSELPSREPGEPSGRPEHQIRLKDGTVGRFAYNVRRAASGLPSRIYVMFNDNVSRSLNMKGQHIAGSAWRQLDPAIQADLKVIADLNGVDLDRVPVSLIHRPNSGFTKQAASTIWHEDAHGMISQIAIPQSAQTGRSLRNSTGLVPQLFGEVRARIPQELQGTFDDLQKALTSRFSGLYGERELPEEAFVHAATAIRHGDTSAIAHFAAADTSVEHVYRTVEAIADQLRKAAAEMPPGNAKNFIMDRLGLISSFSNVDRYKAVKQIAEQVFSSVSDDPFVLNKLAGQVSYDSFKAIVAASEESLEGRMLSPNYTSWAEAAGVRGALSPSQLPVGKTPPPMPDTGIEDGWHFVGPQALLEKITPTMSWVDKIDSKLNEKFAAKGKYLPLADRVRAVFENYRAGEVWLDSNRKSAAEFLVGGKQKLDSYYAMLTKPESQWGALSHKLGLNNDDIARLKKAQSWLQNFQADTNVPVFNYLREDWPKLARANYDTERVYGGLSAKTDSMSTFHRLIATGELNPRDTHLGRFIQVALREGMERKFTGNALKELRQVINLKTDEGKYVLGQLREPVQRLHDYMRGIPDNSGRIINRFVQDTQGAITNQFKALNKHLPAGFRLPEDIAWPRNLLGRMMIFSYASGIGGRPAIALRDAMQGVSLSMPIMGPKAFFAGMARAFTKEGWEAADKAGALLKNKNIGELFGDIYSELPIHKGNVLDRAQEMSAWLLSPSRWGHNIARRTVFVGSAADALPKVRSLRQLERFTEADARTFLEDTGLWFADKARQKQLISMARDKYVDPKEVAKAIGLEMVDLTLWPYRRGTQPGFLRTGVGRVFGQYGLWPMNFIDYITRMVGKIPDHPKKAIPALAMWLGVNAGLIEAGRKMGVETGHWFGISPAGFAGSPHFNFMMDVAKSLKDDQQGREARKRVLEYPLQFAPAYNEIRVIGDTWDKPMFEEDGTPTRDFFKVMGFKPYDPSEPTLDKVLGGDLDFDHFMQHETGGKTQYQKSWEDFTK